MKKYVVAFITLAALLILSGCKDEPVMKDEFTVYDLPVIKKITDNQFIHKIDDDSMAISMQYGIGSRLVVDASYYLNHEVARGDFICYTITANQEGTDQVSQQEYAVARVIALPGEALRITKGQIYINDRKLDTFYGNGAVATDRKFLSEFDIDLVIPPKQYYVMGDVWWRSFNNSINNGPLSHDQIMGKVVGWMPKAERTDLTTVNYNEEIWTALNSKKSNKAKINDIFTQINHIDWKRYLATYPDNPTQLLDFIFANISLVDGTGTAQIMKATTNLDGALTESFSAIVGELFITHKQRTIKSLSGIENKYIYAVAPLIAYYCSNHNINQIIDETRVLLESDTMDIVDKSTIKLLLPELEKYATENEAELIGDKEMDQAIQEAAVFLKLLKARDAEGLLKLLSNTNSYVTQLKQAKEIIKGFEKNFDLATLEEKIDLSENGTRPEHGQYVFRITDNGNNAQQLEKHRETQILVIIYDSSGHLKIDNSFVTYFPFSESMAQEYLKLIKANKAQELAAFLNSDDLEVPIEVAEKTIKKYKESMDLDSASVHYESWFTYIIKDSKKVKHQINIIFGDGLMGIRDEYVPDFPQ
ncbi:signal peptidase I [Cohnella abietis]|uniref:Signal peptidase I n=1 Tax=Cohnella abietis TaxID=2507935 RepID=A0A3T1D805_9BACL|nr:signal peptidase I [Cohnella abietis]BBI34185.1 hypothetical protein KCTCHS21_35840 [Cohnella abietis]